MLKARAPRGAEEGAVGEQAGEEERASRHPWRVFVRDDYRPAHGTAFALQRRDGNDHAAPLA
jgi:hypothetical protein